MNSDSLRGGDRSLAFFIAYTALDAAVAERLYDLLATNSTVFLDRRSLRLGDDWDMELAAAQRRAHTTVVLVSDQTEEGFYQREEIATAIEMARRGSHRVVPLWLSGGSRPLNAPYGLRIKQGLEVHGPDGLAEAARRLLEDSIDNRLAESRPPSPASDPGDAPTSVDHILLRIPEDALTRLEVVAFSPDGRYVATAASWRDSAAPARIFEFPSGREILSLTHPIDVNRPRTIWDVAFSRDGRHVVTAGRGGVYVWELPSGLPTRRIGKPRAEFTHVSFGPGGLSLVTADGGKFVSVWNAADGRLIRQLKHGLFGTVNDIAESDDCRYLATAGGMDDSARVWELPSGRLIRTVKHESVRCVALSPDGRYLATASTRWAKSNGRAVGGIVRSWDLTRSTESVDLPEVGYVANLAFSPDGTLLASASTSSDTVRLWHMPEGREIRSLKHEKLVNAVAFGPDGRHLATAGVGGAQVWALAGM
jgi:WD40 repeat protein